MSQVEAQTSTIDGATYRVHMLDPIVASDMLVDLTRTLAPALGAMAGTLIGAENTQDKIAELLDGSPDNMPGGNADTIERAIVGLVDRIEKAKLNEIIRTLADVTEVQQGEAWPKLSSVMTIHFRGKLALMYRWLGFALKVQFADFFAGIGPAIGRVVR